MDSTQFARMPLKESYNLPKVLEFELVDHNNTAPEIDFQASPLCYVEFKNTKTRIDFNGTSINVSSTTGKWRFEVKQNEIKAYRENTLVGTITPTLSSLDLNIGISGGRNCTLKDIIIKPL